MIQTHCVVLTWVLTCLCAAEIPHHQNKLKIRMARCTDQDLVLTFSNPDLKRECAYVIFSRP